MDGAKILRRNSLLYVVSLVILTAIPSMEAVYSETAYIFESGFESGSFNEWTGTSVTSGETAAVVQISPYDGSYHARFTTDGGATTARAYSYKDITEVSEVYVRMYVRIEGGLPLKTWTSLWLIQFQDAGGSILASYGIKADGTGTKWAIMRSNINAYATSGPSEHTWYLVEAYFKKAASGKTLIIYVDGSEVASLSLDTSGAGNVARVRSGIAYNNPGYTFNVYIDNISIDGDGNSVYNPHMLRVSGTRLVDGYGGEVYLRGVQVDWNERMKRYGSNDCAAPGETTWFTSDDVRVISEAGGNLLELFGIRLSEVMPQRNVVDESFFVNWVDKWVSWSTQYKVYAIINIGSLERPRQSSIDQWGLEMPSWLWEGLYPQPTDMASQAKVVHDFWDTDVSKQEENRQAFINAWAYIAERYKDNQYVLFGLINEPLCHTEWPYMNSSYGAHLGQTYSTVITRVIDAIRDTGAEQVIFVDRPYVRGLSNIQPIDRANIVWEDHLYVTRERDINLWKQEVDKKVNRFVNDFGRPLYMGEYGIDPYSLVEEEPWASTWKNILAEQVAYLDGKSISGRTWHQWAYLQGEYYDYVYNYFTKEESGFIIRTVLG